MQNKSWYCLDLITIDFRWKTSSWWQHISLYNSNICHHDNSTFTHMPVSYPCCLLCCTPIPWQMFAFVWKSMMKVWMPPLVFGTENSKGDRQEFKKLAVWCGLNDLELNTLKKVEMIVDFRRNPPHSPPTHHHEQHCDCSGVIQIPAHHNFSEPEVGQSQPGLTKIRTSVHFLCDTVLYTLLHVSPQFQREMSSEWR